MKNKTIEVVLDALIVISVLFLVVFIYLTHFDASGSSLSQGYIGSNGDINLNNYIFVPLVTFVISMTVAWRVRAPLKVTLAIRSFGIGIARKHDPNLKRHLLLSLGIGVGLLVILVASATAHGYVHHYSILNNEEKLCGHKPVIISTPQTPLVSFGSWEPIVDISTPNSQTYSAYVKYDPIRDTLDPTTIGSMTCTVRQAEAQNPGAEVDP